MAYSGQEFATPADALAHFGVKGMHWGVRKSEPPPTYEPTVDPVALGSPIKKMDKTIHTNTQDAAYQVSALLKDRYGYEVNEIRAIPPTRMNKKYIAFVESDPSATKGVIHTQQIDQEPLLKKLEEKKWFAEGCGNIRATMTHETAHSMFHAEQTTTGFFVQKTTGGNFQAREKAMDAATKAAKADGIRKYKMPQKTSGYANAALYQEEFEAEMFSGYHWNPNPPRFVQVWGETLHKEMGLDPTPFRKVVK